MNKRTNIHLYWSYALVVITIIICLTLVILWYHPITFRFEMDDNTLEAVKSINWSVIQNVSQ